MPAAFSLQVTNRDEAEVHGVVSSKTRRPDPTVQEQASKCRWQARAKQMIAAYAISSDLQAWAGRADRSLRP